MNEIGPQEWRHTLHLTYEYFYNELSECGNRNFIVSFLQIVGSKYSVTQEIALKEAEKPGCGFIHPYDHPEVWYGYFSHNKSVTLLFKNVCKNQNIKDMITRKVTIASA